MSTSKKKKATKSILSDSTLSAVRARSCATAKLRQWKLRHFLPNSIKNANNVPYPFRLGTRVVSTWSHVSPVPVMATVVDYGPDGYGYSIYVYVDGDPELHYGAAGFAWVEWEKLRIWQKFRVRILSAFLRFCDGRL